MDNREFLSMYGYALWILGPQGTPQSLGTYSEIKQLLEAIRQERHALRMYNYHFISISD